MDGMIENCLSIYQLITTLYVRYHGIGLGTNINNPFVEVIPKTAPLRASCPILGFSGRGRLGACTIRLGRSNYHKFPLMRKALIP
jgi:hypothetical protein